LLSIEAAPTAQAEGWHLRSPAALDHRLRKALVAELRREEVRLPRAGAVVAHVALAGLSDPAGGGGVRLAKEWIGRRPQNFLKKMSLQRNKIWAAVFQLLGALNLPPSPSALFCPASALPARGFFCARGFIVRSS
jgi:hypothetical protein